MHISIVLRLHTRMSRTDWLLNGQALSKLQAAGADQVKKGGG